MKKLIGYLKSAKDQRVKIPLPTRGRGMRILSTQIWLLETFTGADWSGHKGHRKSTSSVHAVNGCVVFATSRGQKVVSLSSAESDYIHELEGRVMEYSFGNALSF